jgi:hypothetical protein
MATREVAYVWLKNTHAFIFYIAFYLMERLPVSSFHLEEYITGAAKLPNNFWKFSLILYDWCLLKFRNDLVSTLRLSPNSKPSESTIKERVKLLKRQYLVARRDRSFSSFKTYVYGQNFKESGREHDSFHFYFVFAACSKTCVDRRIDTMITVNASPTN